MMGAMSKSARVLKKTTRVIRIACYECRVAERAFAAHGLYHAQRNADATIFLERVSRKDAKPQSEIEMLFLASLFTPTLSVGATLRETSFDVEKEKSYHKDTKTLRGKRDF